MPFESRMQSVGKNLVENSMKTLIGSIEEMLDLSILSTREITINPKPPIS